MGVEHRTDATEQAQLVAERIMTGDRAPYAPVPSFWSDQHDLKLRAHSHLRGHDGVNLAEGDLKSRGCSPLQQRAGNDRSPGGGGRQSTWPMAVPDRIRNYSEPAFVWLGSSQIGIVCSNIHLHVVSRPLLLVNTSSAQWRVIGQRLPPPAHGGQQSLQGWRPIWTARPSRPPDPR